MRGPLNVRKDQYILSITVPLCTDYDMETLSKKAESTT
jgi:hypothetical protein